MKKLLKIIVLSCAFLPFSISAQQTSGSKSLMHKMDEHNVLNSIELAANIGTTGLGLEVASPLTEWAKLRAGVDWMPPFTIPMTFSMGNYVDGKVSDKFDKIQEMMYGISGMTIDQEIKMDSKPTMTTFRLLVDVYPFKTNKHWHFTAGFFLGGNSIGTSLNKMSEMPSLLALNMYDRKYQIVTADDFLDRVWDDPNLLAELIGMPGLEGQYLDYDMAEQLQNKMRSLGQLGVHVGDHKVINEETGEEELVPYLMMPDKDGTVSAKAKVNRFRPYVGFGYGGALSADGKWQVSFDAGVQFWGGAPKVTTHDGTVLNDLVNLRGKVGTYMDLMKAIPVYPTIDFRISYRF